MASIANKNRTNWSKGPGNNFTGSHLVVVMASCTEIDQKINKTG